MKTEDKKKSNGLIWIILLVIVAVCVWAGSAAFIRGLYPDSLAKSAQFGDMFGAINALFSGLALGGVVVAIFLQSRDLELQREEMSGQTDQFEAQREEMAAQVEFMYQQSLTMIRQRSQDGFFQLLRNLNDIIADMQLGGVRGRASFKKAMSHYEGYVQTRRNKGDKKATHLAIGDLFHNLGDNLNQYLGFMEVLLVYVKSQDDKDRPRYIDIVLANMTVHETRLLQMISNMEEPVYIDLKHLFKEFGLHQPAAARAVIRNSSA